MCNDSKAKFVNKVIDSGMKKLIGLVFFLSVLFISAQTDNVTIHTVAQGETLYSIARTYNISTGSILLANGISDKEVKLQLNQKIKIPVKSSANIVPKSNPALLSQESSKQTANSFSKEGDLLIHTVQKGETFYSIIRQYKVLAYDVISVNNLPNTLVREGQKLILPNNATLPDISNAPTKPLIEKPEIPLSVKEIESPVKKEASPKPAPKVAITDNSSKLNTANTSHTIAKGETIYAIGRLYGVTASEIIKLNNIKGDEYKVGQVLLIPNRKTTTATVKPIVKEEPIPVAAAEPKSEVIIVPPVTETKEVVVIKEEPVKAPKKPASKKDTKEKEKVKEADLAAETIEEAKLVLEPKKEKESTVPVIAKEEPVIIKSEENTPSTVVENIPVKPEPKKTVGPDEYGNVFAAYAQNGLTMKKSRGTAVYLSESTVGNPSLALYNGADIGSILKVTNLMNKKSTYVKVIGRIPGVEASSALLKVSSKVAEQLSVLDETFLVEVSSFAKN